MLHRFLLICSLFLAASSAGGQVLPDPQVEALQTKVSRLESKVSDLERQVNKMDASGAVLLLFGAFCALWAQNTGRSAWLWFFLGLIGSVVTVVVLLVKNSNDRFRASLRVKLD
jgi:hypothetical protein